MGPDVTPFARFAALVRSLEGDGVANGELLEALRSPFVELLDPALFEHVAPVSARRGGCVLLHASPSVTLFAMASPPGFVSEVHDHGSWGLVGQVAGAEMETVYDTPVAGGDVVELQPRSSRRMNPGDVATIDPPRRDLHRVVSIGADTSVTLHAFARDVVHDGFTLFTPHTFKRVTYAGRFDNELEGEPATARP